MKLIERTVKQRFYYDEKMYIIEEVTEKYIYVKA